MLPDPKKVFDSTDEENQEAYAKGKKDASSAGFFRRLEHDTFETPGIFDDQRKSKYKSYDAGWRAGENQSYRGEDSSDNSTSSDYSGGGGGGSSEYSSDPLGRFFSFIGSVLVLAFIAIIAFIWVDPKGYDKFLMENVFVDKKNQQGTIGTLSMVNTTNLNMRSGPGVNYPVIQTFPLRHRIVSYGETKMVDGTLWTQASTDDGKIRGWVNRKYLSP